MRRAMHLGFPYLTCTAMAVLAACSRDREAIVDTFAVAGDVVPTANVVRVSDIFVNPEQHLGDTVTVLAEVDEVLTSSVFALDENAYLAGGLNRLLVFSSPRHALTGPDDSWLNDSVRVTGTVWPSDIRAVEGELGTTLAPELKSRMSGARPVLVAHRLERVREGR